MHPLGTPTDIKTRASQNVGCFKYRIPIDTTLTILSDPLPRRVTKHWGRIRTALADGLECDHGSGNGNVQAVDLSGHRNPHSRDR